MNYVDLVEEVSKEMKDHFYNRTDKHVGLVKKYAKKIAEKFPEYEKVKEQSVTHDASKYKEYVCQFVHDDGKTEQ